MSRLAAALLLVAGCQQTTPPSESAAPIPSPADVKATLGEPVFTGNAWFIFHAYGDNVAAADQRFLGKTVVVDVPGTVLKTPAGRYYYGAAVMGRDPASEPNIIAFIAPDQVSKFAELGRYERAKFRGRVVGRSDSAASWKGYLITLEDCELVVP